MTGATYRGAAVAALRLLALFVCPAIALGIEPVAPSSVDVYWNSTRTIAVPGVTTVVVLDEEIAHAQIGNDTIEFAGLSRGDTVALAYVKSTPISIVVHVIEHPARMVPPSLLQREAEMAHGAFGSDLQTSNAGGARTFVGVDYWSWSQLVGENSFTANSQVEDNAQFGHDVNLRTASVAYRTPHVGLNFVDFTQTLTGEMGEDRINNFSQPGSAQLRGAGIALDYGKDHWSLFAGSTVPYYFLSLNGTRDVAGFSFHRRQTNRLSLFGGTSYINAPLSLNGGFQRRNYYMQTAGLSYRVAKGLLIGAQGGYSNGGRMVRGDASYNSFRLSAYGTAIFSSQTFPLNQLQSLFAGTSTIKSGLSFKTTNKLTQGLYYEHTDIVPGLIYRYAGSSDYLSPNIGYLLMRGETLGFAYTYSRNTGGFTAVTNTGSRYDVSLSSQLTQRISNSAQASVGSIQDPLQINSQDQFTFRDSISLPLKSQTLLLGVEQDRVQPSLVALLNQELNLLSPVLQAQFLADPQAFVDSSNFPPEVKALLEAERPSGTTVSASGVFNIGSKLRFSPNVSVLHAANGSQANSWTQTFGYSLVYQIRPTWQLRSSLTNVLLFDAQRDSTLRTTVLGFGFQKTFTAAPGGLPLLRRSRIIEGRVFRDNNINGSFNIGEPGLPGVEVRLEDGEVAVTDELGRYRFPSVSADQHQVSIALTQFRNPVRMTTRSEAPVDLIQQRIAVANFGILDFARLMGNVFNDLRFENQRQPDSRGMQDLELLLDNGKEVRRIQTGGTGDFEVDNVPPGDYKLSLDPASIPANYVAPADAFAVHVSPVSTVVQDIPVRALRSISGQVLLKTKNELELANSAGGRKSLSKSVAPTGSGTDPNADFKFVPLAGVEIIAGSSTATTDGDGKFLLRNLPAGDLNVTVKPVKDVPTGVNIPSGKVKLPPEPVQIQGATIVISNPELLPYLTRDFPSGVAIPAEQKIAATPARRVQPETPRQAVMPPKPMVAQPAAVPTPAPNVAAVAKAAPPTPTPATPTVTTPNATTESAEQGTAMNGTLTRAVCQQLPSLGEIAHCLQQLKHAPTTPPQR